MVKISIGGTEATIQDYEWTSEDAALADMLNAMLSIDGPVGSDPYPDYTAAGIAVASLGGEIVEADELLEDDEEVIY